MIVFEDFGLKENIKVLGYWWTETIGLRNLSIGEEGPVWKCAYYVNLNIIVIFLLI